MAAYPCSDDPSEIIENIVGAGESAEKFDRFVNGGVNEDVQLGAGQPTPTIRKTVRLMKSASAEIDGSDVSGKFSTASGGTASRMLDERFGDMLNVRDFGAVGDGTTDDLAAFQAAAASGKQVFVPEGSYVLSEPVDSPNFIVGPNVTFPSGTVYYKEHDTTYRKAIVKELPFLFQDYGEAKDAISSASGMEARYIYPQGIAFDSDGSLYISYVWVDWTSDIDPADRLTAIVKYGAAFSYVGYVLVPYGLENVVVSDDGGHRYLYYRRSWKNTLMRYDITSATWSGETLSGTEIIRDCDSNYWLDGNKWYILQIFPDVGQEKSRTIVSVYDKSFNHVSSFGLPKTLTGWQTPADPYYPFVPKMQGFCASNGVVYIVHGGNAYQTTGTPGRVGDIGCSAMSTDGSLLKYGVLDSAKFTAKLRGMGYAVERTEAEAGCIHPCGGIFSIYITRVFNDEDADQGGVLIVREFAEDGIDFSDCASSYVPFNLSRYSDAVFPRCGKWNESISNIQGAMRNPFTGEQITTLAQLLDFVVETGIGRVSFYTSSISLETISPILLETGMLVEIRNANNRTCEITTHSTDNKGARWYSATLQTVTNDQNETTTEWVAYNTYPASKTFVLETASPEDLKFGRIVSTNVDQQGGRNVVLTVSCNPSESLTTLYVGGGSTVLRPMDYVNFYVKDSGEGSTLYSSTRILVLGGTAVGPGSETDGTIILGRASARWSTVYAASGSINTSDEREKQDIEAIPEAVLRAWGRVQFQQFRFRDRVAEKGEAARVHVGVIAQRIKESFEAEGLDPFRYGLLCYDEWQAMPAETGETGAETAPAVPAGDRYSVRYDECLALECAYQRWRLEQIEARLNELSGNSTAPSGASPDNI